jgi:hypothetical protein
MGNFEQVPLSLCPDGSVSSSALYDRALIL